MSMSIPTKQKVKEELAPAELAYVQQLTSLVLSRFEDKHRNLTDVFRFIDQRGRGKVKKVDFLAAVERMRISMSREDITKVWGYIDVKSKGYITLADLSLVYSSRMDNNMTKTAETALATEASQHYNQDLANAATSNNARSAYNLGGRT